MPRGRSPNREKAFELWKKSDGKRLLLDIAEELGVNPNYLTSVFNKDENISIKKYILLEKIRRSQNLLKYSDYNIQEIGFYLGFSSQSHFTRKFQEIAGMTPNEYRRKYGYTEKWK